MTESGQHDEQHLKEILDQSSMRNRTLFIAVLFLLIYIPFIVWSTTDLDLFLPDSKIELPLLNIPVSLVGFYFMVPIILWALHFNLLFNLKRHQLKLTQWHQSNPGKSERWLLPFLFNYISILGSSSPDSRLLRFILSVLIYVLPPGILLWIQIRFSAYQNIEMSGFHFVVFCLDIVILTLYRDQIFPQNHKNENVVDQIRTQWTNDFMSFLIVLIVWGSALNFWGTYIIFFSSQSLDWNFNKNLHSIPAKVLETILKPHIELIDKELVKKLPEKWSNCEGDIDSVKGYDLQNRSLIFANFRGADLAKVDLRNANLTGAIFMTACLRKANLTDAKLQGANLGRAELQGANLNDARLQGAYLRLAELQGAYLIEAELQGANLNDAKLQGADLRLAELQGANLWKAKLQGANLNDARLQGAYLWEAKLQGAYLIKAELQGANLLLAELQGAYLIEAELQGAHLHRAELQGAYLTEAELQGAYLSYAKLQGADLIKAELQGADLIKAELQGADLSYAKLQGADLSYTKLQGAILKETQMKGAVFVEFGGLEKLVVEEIDWETGVVEYNLRKLFYEDYLLELYLSRAYQDRIIKSGKEYGKRIEEAIKRINEQNPYFLASNPEGALEVRKELVCSGDQYIQKGILRQDFEQEALKEHAETCD